jgi:uncharacterized membrane protein YdbT with pleckstrin-like domain
MPEGNNTQQELIDDNTIIFTERKRILFFGLPWTFTRYTISPGVITINRGLLNTTEDSCYMYKVQDVRLSATFGEKLFGLSTITCYTGDVTDPELKLIHIRHAKDIKSYLLKTSEEARLKRRTLNTMDIGAHGLDLDGDGIPDSMQ